MQSDASTRLQLNALAETGHRDFYATATQHINGRDKFQFLDTIGKQKQSSFFHPPDHNYSRKKNKSQSCISCGYFVESPFPDEHR
jgi:hypothetical protein